MGLYLNSNNYCFTVMGLNMGAGSEINFFMLASN